MTAEPTLTSRELNRALLARQFLLERSTLGLIPTLERIGGLQTQYAPSAYIGLWSRMRNFRREGLTTALEQRRVIQGTLLRSTIHMVSARDYWLFLAAIRQPRQEWWRRITRHEFGHLDMEGAVAALREHLAGGPRRADELKAMLAARGLPSLIWGGMAQWVDMVRVPPSGTWEQRRADLYSLAETWTRPAAHQESAGLEHLIRRYLGGFGPASIKEIADWAGIPPATLSPMMDHLVTRTASNCWIFRAHRSPPRRRRRPYDSCQPGMRRCWCTPDARRSCPSATARWSSIPGRRTRPRPSSWTAPSPEPGASRVDASSSSRSLRYLPLRA